MTHPLPTLVFIFFLKQINKFKNVTDRTIQSSESEREPPLSMSKLPSCRTLSEFSPEYLPISAPVTFPAPESASFRSPLPLLCN
ncbi:hypothetical protein Bca52824_032722 [Brassica carinata]|uniref:Uncharacterized protein n=1 Tax=Brassica carinata TaxID=52824 RepID=A0A8X7V8X1_BRACI|nr:hypothetical protein Bca52824_032722 [Brassica carinata]